MSDGSPIVRFRLDPDALRAVDEKAEAQGVNRSELLRSIIENYIFGGGEATQNPRLDPPAPPSPSNSPTPPIPPQPPPNTPHLEEPQGVLFAGEPRTREEVDSTAPPEPAPSPSPLIFPVRGRGTWPLDQSTLDMWMDTYDTMDVMYELRKARAWLFEHNERLKTARGMKRFLGSWLRRSNDNGRYQRREDGWQDEPLDETAAMEGMVSPDGKQVYRGSEWVNR